MNQGFRCVLALSLVLSSGLSACVIDDSDDELGETTGEVQSTNRISLNKLSANAVAITRLSGGALSTTVGSLGQTEDGREVLSYIVGCALPAGDALTFVANGAHYTDPGSIGLAPAWKSRALTVSERRWVSACVYARVNFYGVEVHVSLRGDHPALAAPLGEAAQYALTEGAFYGDLFDPAGPRAYACSAVVKETKLSVSTLGLRACSLPATPNSMVTRCGFTYVGPCAALDLGVTPACNRLAAPYGDCRAGRARRAPMAHEVVTVSLSTL